MVTTDVRVAEVRDAHLHRAPASQQVLRTTTITAAARWIAAADEHTGAVEVQSTTKTGHSIEIWVDDTGAQALAPTSTTRAALEAVAGALVLWMAVSAVAVTVFTITRSVCDRIRFAGWQHELDSLVGHGDGHTTSQP